MNKLRAMRFKKKFWTQRELAEASGISKVTISRIENGHVPIDSTLAKLADVLDCEVKDLREEGGDDNE